MKHHVLFIILVSLFGLYPVVGNAQEPTDSVTQQTTQKKQKKEKKEKKSKKEKKGQEQTSPQEAMAQLAKAVKKPRGHKYNMDALRTAIDTINWGKRFRDVRDKNGNLIDFRPAIEGFLDKLANENKDDAEVLYCIAQSYFVGNWVINNGRREFESPLQDSVHAYKYLEMAIAADPTFMRSYQLGAQIKEVARKKDEMMDWLNRGFAINPNDTLLRAAQLLMQSRSGDMDAAIAQMRQLKKENPDYPLEIMIARRYRDLYDEIGGTDNAMGMIEWYKKVPFDQLNGLDAYYYSRYLPTAEIEIAKKEGKSSKEVKEIQNTAMLSSAEMLKSACQRYPNVLLLRIQALKFFADDAVKEYQGAVEMYDNMKALSDFKDKAEYHYCLAQAYTGLKRYDDAQREADLSESMEDATENDKKRAEQIRDDIAEAKANELLDRKDYAGAVTLYKAYMDKKAIDGKQLKTYHRLTYGEFNYKLIVDGMNGVERIPALERHMSIYLDIVKTDSVPKTITTCYSRTLWAANLIVAYDESRIDVVVAPAKQTIEYIEGLPEEERNTTIEAIYADACMKLFKYYSNIFLAQKKKEDREMIKFYGNLVLDHSLNEQDLTNVQETFSSLKIK